MQLNFKPSPLVPVQKLAGDSQNRPKMLVPVQKVAGVSHFRPNFLMANALSKYHIFGHVREEG